MTGRGTGGRWVLGLAAPLLAVLFAVLLSSVVLLAVGNDPVLAFEKMASYGVQPRSVALTVNLATIYYLSALAVAIGFRMNLFNIGVDGQYRLAAFLAAAVGGAVTLPKPLHILLIVAVAVVVGASWAALAALLKVTRGVSEVISTIMLNAIATQVVAYLLNPNRLAVSVAGSNNIGTRPIGPSGQFPGIPYPGSSTPVFGFLVVAVLCGIGYGVLLNRTRFGFDLRATGLSESAAVVSGVNVRRMVLTAMVLSGAVAGLVGMPQLLGASYSYSLDFPAGLGFTGIAVALLGRNHPVGIGLGALLFGFLETSSQILDLEGIPREIVAIMQGTIVLSVVVAYELVRRYRLVLEQRQVGQALSGGPAGGPGLPAEGVPA
ncbi:MAG: ABC transporter permease [Actinomycetota bacterium]